MQLLKMGAYLFEEKIEAWKYGPVIPKVYQNHGILKSLLVEKNDKKIQRVLDIICKVYNEYTSSDLIQLTHQENTPWSNYYKEGKNIEIPKKDIIEYYRPIIFTNELIKYSAFKEAMEDFATR